jgi:nucleoside-diphosphate-sugar epimerase
MSEPSASSNAPETPVVVVTGASGFVGARVCAELVERGAEVRAVVRRPGSAPGLTGLREYVGSFTDPHLAETVVEGATALVTTVHPMGEDEEAQRTVGVEGTRTIGTAARDSGVPLLVHVSTAAVYDRSPSCGDVTEASALVDDDAGAYPVTKRDADAALAGIEGTTRVLLRPPAILGAGESSIWNTLRPRDIADDEGERRDVRARSFAWVHVDDLARLAADLATGAVAVSQDPEQGPVRHGCTAVNVAAEPATAEDYLGTVCDALGVEPVWEDGEVWTGRIVADRAHRWGWTPRVDLASALAELRRGLAPG